VYGLGEHRKPFLKDVNWKQFSFWNADQWPRDGATNLYGSHPFYLNMNPETGSGYGMLWLNSNAMEAILQPTPAVSTLKLQFLSKLSLISIFIRGLLLFFRSELYMKKIEFRGHLILICQPFVFFVTDHFTLTWRNF
jgi:hypothetical protein